MWHLVWSFMPVFTYLLGWYIGYAIGKHKSNAAILDAMVPLEEYELNKSLRENPCVKTSFDKKVSNALAKLRRAVGKD